MHINSTAIASIVFAAVCLSGCGTPWPAWQQDQARQHDPYMETQQNDSRRTLSYLNKINAPKAETPPAATAMVKITIQQAMSKYVPKDYKVSPDSDIDLHTMIVYDQSQPWTEALGKSLGEVGVELTANMYKHTAALRQSQLTLNEIIEKYIPEDYKVFRDSSVDLETQLRYNISLPWPEALGRGASDAGIAVTADLSKKAVVIKPGTQAIEQPAAKPSTRIVTFTQQDSHYTVNKN